MEILQTVSEESVLPIIVSLIPAMPIEVSKLKQISISA